MNNKIKFAISIVLSQVAGILGSLFTAPSIRGWYQYLEKPEFAPPSWLFGPVWTTLISKNYGRTK